MGNVKLPFEGVSANHEAQKFIGTTPTMPSNHKLNKPMDTLFCPAEIKLIGKSQMSREYKK